MNQQHYPFQPEPLPYAYDALEPFIGQSTLHFHHDKHLKTYVDKHLPLILICTIKH